eukprot:7135766-Lingulodinium_polyedra.AAC.1
MDWPVREVRVDLDSLGGHVCKARDFRDRGQRRVVRIDCPAVAIDGAAYGAEAAVWKPNPRGRN